MADREKKRPFDYTLRLKLRGTQDFFGPGVVELLQQIEQTKSLNMAAKAMKMSYNKGWRIIQRAEAELGFPLLATSVGGSNGGGSIVTEEGRRLLAQYLLFQEQTYQIAEACFVKIFVETEEAEWKRSSDV